MPPPGAHALVPRGFPNPGWPLGGFPPAPGAGQPAGPAPGTLATADSFRVLTTCSWEQSDTMVKVYVPLRGVQTDMLRATFTPNSVEVRSDRTVPLPVEMPSVSGKGSCPPAHLCPRLTYLMIGPVTQKPCTQATCTSSAARTRNGMHDCL